MLIGLAGGPCVGKTTLAEAVNKALMARGMDSVFIPEYARAWINEHGHIPETPDECLTIAAKQMWHERSACRHQYIVTDTVTWAELAFITHMPCSQAFMSRVLPALTEHFYRYDRVFLMPRVFDYEHESRDGVSELFARDIDRRIRETIGLFNIPHIRLGENPDEWVGHIVSEL